MMCGGRLSTSLPVTPEIQETTDKVKAQLEEKENKKFDVFKAVSFNKQVVTGLNYFMKVHVGDEKLTRLRVFESLPHENKPLTMSNYETNKTKHDELSYF